MAGPNRKSRVEFINRNPTCILLAVNFLLFCSLPLISCTNDENGNSLDASSEEIRKQFISSHKIENSSGNKNEEYYKSTADEEEHPKLFAGFHESYISRDAAKRFRQRIKSHKKPLSSKDYDDILQDIVFKPKDESKSDIFDKKYFDYLPNEEEEVEEQVIVAEPTDNKKIDEYDANEYEDLDDIENWPSSHRNEAKRSKRDVTFYDNQQFIANERRESGYNQGRNYYNSNLRTRAINPQHYVVTNNDLNPNNPWSNRFYNRPKLNNFYLPVAPPVSAGYFYNVPKKPFAIIVPGNYHNAGMPPQNYLPPHTTTETPTTIDIGNRIETDDDDRPVWDIYDPSNRVLPISSQGSNSITTSTRRPPPPLIHNSDEVRPDIPPRRRKPQGNTSTFPQSGNNNEDPLESGRSPSRIPSNSLGNDRQVNNFGGGSPIWSSDIGRPAAPSVQAMVRPLSSNRQPQQAAASFVPAAQAGPSQCVWGIVTCCAQANLSVRYSCFEQLGCEGAFWDLNPCSDHIYDAALTSADQFYEK